MKFFSARNGNGQRSTQDETRLTEERKRTREAITMLHRMFFHNAARIRWRSTRLVPGGNRQSQK
jgi:hypothetical protein